MQSSLFVKETSSCSKPDDLELVEVDLSGYCCLIGSSLATGHGSSTSCSPSALFFFFYNRFFLFLALALVSSCSFILSLTFWLNSWILRFPCICICSKSSMFCLSILSLFSWSLTKLLIYSILFPIFENSWFCFSNDFRNSSSLSSLSPFSSFLLILFLSAALPEFPPILAGYGAWSWNSWISWGLPVRNL